MGSAKAIAPGIDQFALGVKPQNARPALVKHQDIAIAGHHDALRPPVLPATFGIRYTGPIFNPLIRQTICLNPH
jgi:hypothetical protein